MLTITELAQEKIRDAIESNSEPVLGIRAMAQARSPFQVRFGLAFVNESTKGESDQVEKLNGFDLYIAQDEVQHFKGVSLDYEDGVSGSGFKFINIPKVPKEFEGTMAEKVVKVLEEEINPGIASHGGYVSLVDIKGHDIIIQMGGGCQGCGQADVTLKFGIENSIRANVAGVGDILDVTDHAAGRNPYYQPSGK